MNDRQSQHLPESPELVTYRSSQLSGEPGGTRFWPRRSFSIEPRHHMPFGRDACAFRNNNAAYHTCMKNYTPSDPMIFDLTPTYSCPPQVLLDPQKHRNTAPILLHLETLTLSTSNLPPLRSTSFPISK
jgi:hypothetical protein